MSYLLQFATRRPVARIDERTLLNLPGYHGDAHVRAFVEDTTKMRGRRCQPGARIRLRIADCTNTIGLDFSLETEGQRQNSLHKADTLLDTLRRFREALAAEAELYELRAEQRRAA